MIHPCELRGQALLDNIDALIRRTRLDGIVLTPPFCDKAEVLAFLKSKNIPYARVAPGALDDDSISVRSNDEQAAFEITQLLISLGHKDIAFIKGHPDHSSTTLRFTGYLNALKKNNIEFKPELVDEGNFSYHSGEDSARKIMSLEPKPTAVFASNDYMAAAVLKVASQLSIKVPEEISIAGFDNAPIARHIWPGLTTIAQPVEQMTYTALTKLIEQFNEQNEEQPLHQETLEAQLIIRESTSKNNR